MNQIYNFGSSNIKLEKKDLQRYCKECGMPISKKDGRDKFCSTDCSRKWHGRRIKHLQDEFGKLDNRMYDNLDDKGKDDYLEECRIRIMNER